VTQRNEGPQAQRGDANDRRERLRREWATSRPRHAGCSSTRRADPGRREAGTHASDSIGGEHVTLRLAERFRELRVGGGIREPSGIVDHRAMPFIAV
jgi:hypothetical protein